MKQIFLKLFKVLAFFFLLELMFRFGGFFYVVYQNIDNYLKIARNENIRILCVGDSVTALSNYPILLEKMLNQRQDGHRYIVFNKGILSATTKRLAVALPDLISLYKPHMAVVLIGAEDKPNDLLADDNLIKNLEETLFVKQEERLPWQKIFHSDIDLLKKEIQVFKNLKLLGNNLKIHAQALLAKNVIRSYRQCLVALYPNDANKWLGLAMHYLETRDMQLADKAFERMIRLKTDFSEYQNIIDLYIQKEEYAYVIPWIKRYFTVVSNDQIQPGFALRMAYALMKGGKLPDAEYLLMNIIKEHNRTDAKLLYAKALVELNKKQEAKEIFLSIINTSPSNAVVQEIQQYLSRMDGQERNQVVYINPFYQVIHDILARNQITMVAVQYPFLDIAALKKQFIPKGHVIFIENRSNFIQAKAKENYFRYFQDYITGEFGHMKEPASKLMAESIAQGIDKK